MRALVRQTSGHAGETNGCVSYTLCHTHCVTLYVNNGGKHTDDDLDFGKSLGVCWETWLMMTTLIVECMKRFEYDLYKDIVLFL